MALILLMVIKINILAMIFFLNNIPIVELARPDFLESFEIFRNVNDKTMPRLE